MSTLSNTVCLLALLVVPGPVAAGPPADSRPPLDLLRVEASLRAMVSPRVVRRLEREETMLVQLGISNRDGTLPGTDGPLQAVLRVLGPHRVVDHASRNLVLARVSASDLVRLGNERSLDDLRLHVDPPARGRPGLTDAVNIMDAVAAWDTICEGLPLTGQGRTIAIIDSGVDFNHDDLNGQNVLGFRTLRDCRFDGCPEVRRPDDLLDPHGTFVAGAAAADGALKGVAHGAKLLSLRIAYGENFSANLARAFQWCYDHAETYDIGVINMSFGSFALYADVCDDEEAYRPLSQLIELLWLDRGILTAAATLNDSSITGITWPACHSLTLAVSATNKNDEWASFGNRNALVKVMAPGVQVYTTSLFNTYEYSGGTSLSSPLAAGALAIIAEALEAKGRAMSPPEIELLLHDTGDPVVNLPPDWTRINVKRAVDRIICPADTSGDGTVAVDDLLAQLADWGPCPAPCPSDVNGDGTVDIADLLDLLAAWGPCP